MNQYDIDYALSTLEILKTFAFKGPHCICAFCIRHAFAMQYHTFINIIARGTITRVSRITFTSERTISVGTSSVRMTIVRTGDTFVDISTNGTVALWDLFMQDDI